jgi:hypothetical protein
LTNNKTDDDRHRESINRKPALSQQTQGNAHINAEVRRDPRSAINA